MKQITYVFALLLLTALCSCDSMNDIHSEYLEGGEKIYLGKVDSLKALPGQNRIELNWLINADPRVTKWTVFWSNRTEKREVEKGTNMAGDTIKISLTDLVEDTYTFEVVSYDDEGNKSLPVELTARSYGEFYISNLHNRAIKSYKVDGEFPSNMQEVTIEWETAPEGCLKTVVYFENKDGEEQKIEVLPSDSKTIISEWYNEIRYESSYLPVPMAVDTFASKASRLKPQKIVGGTYLDFAGENEVVEQNGISIVSSANDWGFPDSSDGSITHNGNCYDNKGNGASDFTISVTGLGENKKYLLYAVVVGKDHDFAWGTAADGAPVNTEDGLNNFDGGIEIKSGLYAIPLKADFVSTTDGKLLVWFGNGTSARTQFDGIAIIPAE
ncbi:DUF4998 domain-containing protein [Prolixibacteraceae bacterium JC049]|nr:DUF4998 domain-containing protein [Prolixibacteraceae bacterium JC049]